VVVVTGCSDDGIRKINTDDITFGTLKIHLDGTLVKDISLTENNGLLKAPEEHYNNSDFLTEEKENKDPILTDEPLEKNISASYFNVDESLSGNNFYIGYIMERIFLKFHSFG
jgi:hypothetical protein